MPCGVIGSTPSSGEGDSGSMPDGATVCGCGGIGRRI